MKRTYNTPAVIANGDLGPHTRTAIMWFGAFDGQPNRKDTSFGTVGFGL